MQYSHGPTYGPASSARVASSLTSSQQRSQGGPVEQGLTWEEHSKTAGVHTSGKRTGFPGQQPWSCIERVNTVMS